MSRDDKTQVGAVLVNEDKAVVSTGFNDFPGGVNDTDPSRHQRPEKYRWMEHGERNAIYYAARHGSRTKGCTLFINAPPCTDCARAIIQAGIVQVIYPEHHAFLNREDWASDIKAAKEMMEEVGIKILEHNPA
jgi:dCMP deaminase